MEVGVRHQTSGGRCPRCSIDSDFAVQSVRKPGIPPGHTACASLRTARDPVLQFCLLMIGIAEHGSPASVQRIDDHWPDHRSAPARMIASRSLRLFIGEDTIGQTVLCKYENGFHKTFPVPKASLTNYSFASLLPVLPTNPDAASPMPQMDRYCGH
jgi:hypothetical protein